MEWKELHPAMITNPDLSRVWSLLHDSNTALAMVSELKAGGFTIVYTHAKERPPQVEEGPALTSVDVAKARAEEIVRSQMIVPKVAIERPTVPKFTLTNGVIHER